MDSRPHVLSLIPLPAMTREALAQRYQLHLAARGLSDPVDALVPLDRIVAVVTNGTTGLSAEWIQQMPALRVVSAFGVGYENVDVPAAHARGVIVTNAPGTNDETVADHALGFMLALSRGYAVLTHAVRNGQWDSARAAQPTLCGATVGIIGMGRIGQGIARRCAAFGMRVLYNTRTSRSDLPYAHESDLLKMAEQCDYLVAACPGGAATRHIINAEVLRALGSQGFVVNVARGSVVHTADLVHALQADVIAGAGLDVFEGEPTIPDALKAMDNVLLTPHMAGRSPAAHRAQTDVLLASFADALQGRRPAMVIAA
ncbi:2-hydroxyacid dehydrogenase (plasmid) [Diaphorobacter sp. HDW4B]|uniref:2-hydroxyacid dehydrogenase n=1 Tax=Diaphorobacter sp. HDW4B TaxID=2714925 RepID=UPI00140AECBC|nr:2-hydroxyacid dehydrogenase [Diaphorobacter sp. HDW4B]QIL73840.1 2-hydroxyacid dehydrogenase [Diaphorobacter sp. HDW4B]